MDTMTDSENRVLKDQFMLRLPDGLRDKVKGIAQANNRSMNAEIVHALMLHIAEHEDTVEHETANDGKIYEPSPELRALVDQSFDQMKADLLRKLAYGEDK